MRDRAPDGAELERAAEMFRAAGDPARLRLLEHLAVGEASVSELADLARQGLSTVSQQLRVLHQAGLVKRRREGKHVYYRPAASGPGCHTDVDWPRALDLQRGDETVRSCPPRGRLFGRARAHVDRSQRALPSLASGRARRDGARRCHGAQAPQKSEFFPRSASNSNMIAADVDPPVG